MSASFFAIAQNRSMAQLALRANRHWTEVARMIVWGNHSNTQFPDWFPDLRCPPTLDEVQPLNDIYWYMSVPSYILGSFPALVALAVLLFATVGIYTWMSFALVERRRYGYAAG